jgi:hypothetical protein|tara:strand:- start:98 stop:271 length:174 start_codon:yes stop_codon:yes gene_type:complete
MAKKKEVNKAVRKSLAVDVETFDMLQEICNVERRNKIQQLQILIKKEHSRKVKSNAA